MIHTYKIFYGVGSVTMAGDEMLRLGGKRVMIVTDPGYGV